MRKAIKTNLGGFIFHIDDDAYDKLHAYLQAIGNQFGNSSESKEILNDIEARIAELFQSRISDSKQVISVSDVDEIIKIMGQPADFATDYDEQDSNNNTSQTVYTGRRRFYRDTDNSVIGGVCSGLGAYFNIDPVLVRIIFVILFFIGGSTFLVYLILWIALPAAVTTAQKLELRGEEVTISNIEKAVKKENEYTRDNTRQSRPGDKFRDFLDDVFNAFGTLIRIFAKIFVVIFGIILVAIGISLIIAFVSASVGLPWAFHNNGLEVNNIAIIIGQFISPAKATLLTFAMVFLVIIPVFAILYLGLKLIFRFKLNDKYYLLASLAAWILSIIIFIALGVNTFKVLANEGTRTTQFQIKTSPKHTLVLKGDEAYTQDLHKFLKIDYDMKYFIYNRSKILGEPELVIEHSTDSTAYIEIERKSRGENYETAYDNAHAIVYNVSQSDTVVHFDKLFELSGNKLRFQQVKLTFHIPEGTKIYFDKSVKSILTHAQNNDDLWPSELVNKYWIMGNEGLRNIEK